LTHPVDDSETCGGQLPDGVRIVQVHLKFGRMKPHAEFIHNERVAKKSG
jgi:hypothetical protein